MYKSTVDSNSNPLAQLIHSMNAQSSKISVKFSSIHMRISHSATDPPATFFTDVRMLLRRDLLIWGWGDLWRSARVVIIRRVVEGVEEWCEREMRRV